MARDLKALISQMTLEEKAGLCSGGSFWYTKGIERLGIPSVMLTDGPHGLRKQPDGGDHLGIMASIDAVCFPAACATAASFDVDLMYHMGQILGNECQAENVSVLLGPAVNIKRSPLCGRNFEYISEDPYLTGKMAASYIRGVQSKHVGTSIKHFAVNNQETNRMGVSAEISQQALREIYLPGFEEAVKAAQPKTVMCSYNMINGVYSSENEWLLTKVLRDEWGFEGYVVTDWGAVGDRVAGVKAGLDLEMPASNGATDAMIVEAVRSGALDEAVLDKTVERLLKVLYDYADNRDPDAIFDREADHAEAVKIASECAVLLENNGVLPLKKDANVVYIGSFASAPRYQGGGSSHINSTKVCSALASAEAKGRKVSYVPGFSATEDMLEGELTETVEKAKNADVAVIFAGLPDAYESEGYDRDHMKMPPCQDALIEAVAAVQPNTVVVLHNGSPVECPWADKVAAILEMYLGGQGVGEACDQLLWGEKNPCGRLAETFPLRLEHNPSYINFPGDGKKAYYDEGVFVGYRYYDTKKLPVRWGFGHGRSYTKFAYSNLKLSCETMSDDSVLEVSVDVTNIGSCAGKEVVQLYVSDRNGTPRRPAKELKGFAKVKLNPSETKTVTLLLTARDLGYWHEVADNWYTPSGTYGILIGHASDDIRISTNVTFTTSKLPPMRVTPATTMGQLMADPRTAPVVQNMMANMGGGSDSGMDMNDPATRKMIENALLGTPLKAFASFGMMTHEQVQDLIQMLNGLLDVQ